jgi:WD40 repeat protein
MHNSGEKNPNTSKKWLIIAFTIIAIVFVVYTSATHSLWPELNTIVKKPDTDYLQKAAAGENFSQTPIQSTDPLWNYSTGGHVYSVATNSNGNHIIAGTDNNTLFNFYRNGSLSWNFSQTTGLSTQPYFKSVAMTADGDYIYAVRDLCPSCFFHRNGTLLWGCQNWESGKVIGVSGGISSDGSYLVMSTEIHNKVYFRNDTGKILWQFTTYDLENPSEWNDHTGVHVSISADGQHVAAVSEDSRVYFFNKSGSLLWSNITGRSLENVAMSANGKYIAVASRDHNVYYYDAFGTRIWNYTTGGIVKNVAVNRDGNYITAGSDDSHVYLFDRNGTLLWKYLTGGPVDSVSMSLEGLTITAGSDDHSVYCFNPTGNLLWKYTTGDKVKSVSVSGDGEYVAAGSWDGNVYFFHRSGSNVG